MSPETRNGWWSVWREEGAVHVRLNHGCALRLTPEQASLLAADLEWVAQLPEVQHVG